MVEVANGPWHPEQFEVYSAAPSITAGGVVPTGGTPEPGTVGLSAASIACKSAPVRLIKLPIPPMLPLIAFWMRTKVAPNLVEVAKGPWQPEQMLVYKVAPEVPAPGRGAGGAGGAEAGLLIAMSMACISPAFNLERKLIPPKSLAMAAEMVAGVLIPIKAELAMLP